MTEPQVPRHPSVTSPMAARRLFRAGLRVPTSGWSAGFTQSNLIALPRDLARDFLLFAQRNPKSCPVLDVTRPGAVSSPIFDGDLRTDLPAYVIYEHGEPVAEVTDATDFWRDDLVAFLIGCSFTFEAALLRAGVPVRHIEQCRNVPIFRTSIDCRPAGRLAGPLLVSMRPVPASQVATAVRATAGYLGVHGEPVHIGDPAALGISDLHSPDFGDAVEILPGEIPVFWACGVTPQAAVMASRPEFAIGHAPGHMAITDARDSDQLVP